LKLEYLYVDLGTATNGFAIPLNPAQFTAAAVAASAFNVASSIRFTDNVIRVGLNYKIY
jgi:hypothetical protein